MIMYSYQHVLPLFGLIYCLRRNDTTEMKIIRKPSPMLPMVMQIVVAPPSGHSVMHPVQAGAEHALWQVIFTSSLITTSK